MIAGLTRPALFWVTAGLSSLHTCINHIKQVAVPSTCHTRENTKAWRSAWRAVKREWPVRSHVISHPVLHAHARQRVHNPGIIFSWSLCVIFFPPGDSSQTQPHRKPVWSGEHSPVSFLSLGLIFTRIFTMQPLSLCISNRRMLTWLRGTSDHVHTNRLRTSLATNSSGRRVKKPGF